MVFLMQIAAAWYTVQEWGLLKLRSSISPLAKFLISQRYLLRSLNLIHIDRCHRSWAAATPVKYKRDIQ